MKLRRSERVHPLQRARRSCVHLAVSVLALTVALLVAPPVAAAPAPAAAAAPDDGVLRVLLFYKDNFHASHVQARQAVRDLAAELGTEYAQTVQIQETQDPTVFNPTNLAMVDTVVFAQTGECSSTPTSARPSRPTSAAAAATWACTTPAGPSARASTT